MSTPTFTTSKPVTTITHTREIKTRTPDYLDILTVILPVLTFIAGYYLNNLVENRKEKKRLKQVEQYFFALTVAIVSAIEVQVMAIQDAISRIEAMADDNLAVGIVSELRTTRIKSIPDLDLYKIFVANRPQIEENTNYLITLSTSLDFIEDIQTRIKDINSDVSNMVNNYIEEYNVDNGVLAEENKKMFNEQQALNSEFRRLNIIVTQIARPYENKPMGRNLTDSYKNYIAPLYNATRSIANNADTSRMLYIITKINGDYKNFLSGKELAIELLGDLVINLKNIEGEFRHIVKHFKKNPMRP